MSLDLLFEPLIGRALSACLIAGLASGIVGTLVVVRRISSISGSMAHAALGGVGIAKYYGASPALGAGIFSVFIALMMGHLHFRAKAELETVIMMIWSVGMAIGVLFMAMTPGYALPLESFLFGSILLVPDEYLWLGGMVNFLLLLFVAMLYHSFRAVCFDEEYSTVSGFPTKRLFVTMLILVALATVVLMKVVGVILMIALLTTPAIVGRHWAEDLITIMLIATAIAISCCVGGLFLSYYLSLGWNYSLPTGPLIVLLAALTYFVSIVLRAFLRRSA